MRPVSCRCTACGLCISKCPKSAIHFEKNEYREIISVIDESKCVNCGLCDKLCPEQNPVKVETPRKCFAAWTTNNYDYRTTASGGIATALSKWCLNNGGVVYGAEMLSDGYVVHRRIDSIGGLDRLKGSKYVQSDFSGVFDMLKKDVLSKKHIVVVGTPCQIAAVKSGFKEKDLENVFLIDLVCHGCPSDDYFKDYLNTIVGTNDKSRKISFRNKGYFLKVTQNDELIYYKKWQADPYFRSFMYGMIFRENCYECKYSRPERVSDLTLCDFWGLHKKNLNTKNSPQYVSGILANTPKGEWLVDQCKEIVLEERSLNEAVEGNHNLNNPSPKHKDRKHFLKCITQGMNFIDCINKTSIKNEIKFFKILEILKIPYRLIRYGKNHI